MLFTCCPVGNYCSRKLNSLLTHSFFLSLSHHGDTIAIVNGRQTVSAAVDKEQVNEPVNFWSSTTAAEAAKTTTAMVTMTEQQQQQRHHINIEPNDENCTTNKAINVSSSMPQSLPPESTCTECCALLSVSLSSNSQWVNMKKSRKQHQSPPPALLSSSSSSSTTTTWFSLPQQQPQIHSQKQSASSYNTSVNNRRWKSRIGNITDRILSTSSLFVILLLLCTIMIHSAGKCTPFYLLYHNLLTSSSKTVQLNQSYLFHFIDCNEVCACVLTLEHCNVSHRIQAAPMLVTSNDCVVVARPELRQPLVRAMVAVSRARPRVNPLTTSLAPIV